MLMTSDPVSVYKKRSAFRATRQQPPSPGSLLKFWSLEGNYFSLLLLYLRLVSGLWKSDLADILERLFICSSLHHFVFNRSDHCNHAEGRSCSWMPPEPRSGSACKWNIHILNINTSFLICWSLYCYCNSIMWALSNVWFVDFLQMEAAHKRVARSDSSSGSNSGSNSGEVSVFFVYSLEFNIQHTWVSATVRLLKNSSLTIHLSESLSFSWTAPPPRLQLQLQQLPLQLQQLQLQLQEQQLQLQLQQL